MSQQIKNIFYSQTCSLDDWFSNHNFGIKGNTLKKLLFCHYYISFS